MITPASEPPPEAPPAEAPSSDLASASDPDPRELAFAEEFDAETAAMLRGFFSEEAAEHLAAMEQTLARLEERPTDSTLVDALFRAAHTIKGAAATVGLGRISEAAHRLEDRFEEIRDRGEPATPARLSSLIRATDLLRAMVETTDTRAHLRLLADIRTLVEASSGTPAQVTTPTPRESSPRPAPASPPPGPIGEAPMEADWDEETQQVSCGRPSPRRPRSFSGRSIPSWKPSRRVAGRHRTWIDCSASSTP